MPVFTEEFLFSEHDYARPQEVDGQRLHGGFLADGTYQPPRSLGRTEALDAWTQQLRQAGGELLDADSSLLSGARMPNPAQHRLLLANGIGQAFWNMLTITAKIEARGRLLAEMEFPDIADYTDTDISGMAIGHLNRGLLRAHGIDEGGQPDEGIGGHDAMWFAARDLVFGPDAFDDAEPPERIGRPESDQRAAPELPPEIEGLIGFLQNLLIIEFRAEIGFAMTQAMLDDPELFGERREEAAEASAIIGRIRTDEEVHVTSLRLYLGEIRSIDLRTVDGGVISGAEVIDRMWDDLVHWAVVTQPQQVAHSEHEPLVDLITRNGGDAALVAEFNRISDLAPSAS